MFSDFTGYRKLTTDGIEHIDSLTININDGPNANRGARFELDSVTAVPAPASFVLLLSMLPVAGGYFRRLRKAQLQ
jgi:hypothetical protein